MSEDRDLFGPGELVAPPPNRDHTEDQRVRELEGLSEGEQPGVERPGVAQPLGEDSAAVVM